MKVVVLLLVFLPFNGSISLTYFVKKEKDKKTYSCVAENYERYQAVGWVYPIPSNEENMPNIITEFAPNITDNYNCDFYKDNLCSEGWNLKNWKIDNTSTKTRELMADYRWEDLPTIFISNPSTEFTERIEIDKVFRSGFSVRANDAVELLMCSGWNPYIHPCYHFNIDPTQIYINKYSTLPQDLSIISTTYLQHYKPFSNILYRYEWRNFVISFDEKNTVKLFGMDSYRPIIEHVDRDNFTPLYLLMRSREASLWKFHKNEFLYTNTAQISKLGPELTVHRKDLCVSLLVSLCQNCEMIFFYRDATMRKLLKKVHLENIQWTEIKLQDENVTTDKLNIFVETKLKDPKSNETGFWAIDNVRICKENEVKISHLKLNADIKIDDYISCQMIKYPSWKPKEFEYNGTEGFPDVTVNSNTTWIKLAWPEKDTKNKISYYITYEANDLCTTEPYNLGRIKSNGFLTTKNNEINLYGLVPFTEYNITISSVLHGKVKQIVVKTSETLEPTMEELSRNLLVKVFNSSVNISWQNDCSSIYGQLVYTLIVTNEQLDFKKQLSLKNYTNCTIAGLQPYTNYSLKIITARNKTNIINGVHITTMVHNFTTLPGVAPPVENLELYSADENSLSFRYDLPKDPKGKLTEVQVRQCAFYWLIRKCDTSINPIKQCPLWPDKLCLFVPILPRLRSPRYSVEVRLRNNGTDFFGKDVTMSGRAKERVPGVPTNITYRNVDCGVLADYCNLNISWMHPYNENGTITFFNVILNTTSKYDDIRENMFIQQQYKVENKSYLPKYTYQIKYFPYGSFYKLYLQSGNKLYKSDFTHIMVRIDDLGNHIDQSPKLLNITDHSLVFKLAPFDARLDFYDLTVVVQDFDAKKDLEPEFLEANNFTNDLCLKFGNTWISQKIRIEIDSVDNIIITNSSEKHRIKPKTGYCITFIITNKYKGTEHNVVYYERLDTPDITKKPSYSYFYMLLLLPLLFILIISCIFVHRCLRKKRKYTVKENNENVYESLTLSSYQTSNGTNSYGYLRPVHS